MLLTKQEVVSYKIENMAVEVTCKTQAEVDAVKAFAQVNNFPCPAPAGSRPVYSTYAKTHPGGDVLW